MHTIKLHPTYYLNISVQAANLSDCRIESNRKNRFGSENRIESNRNFFLPELESSAAHAAPQSLVAYTNRPCGHGRSCKKRLRIVHTAQAPRTNHCLFQCRYHRYDGRVLSSVFQLKILRLNVYDNDLISLYCPLSYIFYGVSLAGVRCRRRWPPPTTLALATLLG